MATVRFEQPGYYVPRPRLLKAALMLGLGLTGDLDMVSCLEHDGSGTSTPTTATPVLVKGLRESRHWVGLILVGGKSAWWNPQRAKVQWELPLIVAHGVREMRNMLYQEVVGNGRIAKWYHMRTNDVFVVKPPAMIKLVQQYQKQPKPQPKPQQARSSGPDPRKTTPRVFSASLVGYPGPQLDDNTIKTKTRAFQKARFYCDPQILDEEGMRIIIHSGIDQFIGFDIRSDYCRANILAAWTEVRDTGNISEAHHLLSIALVERYWHKGHFDMQEGYIYFICSQKDHLELWCPRVSVSQAKTVLNICCALRSRYRLQGRNIKGMNEMELATFQKIELLVKMLFPEDFASCGQLNQEAVNYRPLKFPVARGKAKIEHPTQPMSKELFKRIKEYFLKPASSDFWTSATTGPMRGSEDKEDADMDEDVDGAKHIEEDDSD